MDPMGTIPNVDVQEAARRAGEGEGGSAAPVLVDVREASELAELRVAGAIHLPLSDLAGRASELPDGRPLLVFCASGRRSLVAADYLRRHGHADVSNVVGGIIEWERRGLPVIRGG